MRDISHDQWDVAAAPNRVTAEKSNYTMFSTSGIGISIDNRRVESISEVRRLHLAGIKQYSVTLAPSWVTTKNVAAQAQYIRHWHQQ